jgi:hypothetical protein
VLQVIAEQLFSQARAGLEGDSTENAFSALQKVKIVRFGWLQELSNTPETENPKSRFLPAGNWVRKSSLFSCRQEIPIRFYLTLG